MAQTHRRSVARKGNGILCKTPIHSGLYAGAESLLPFLRANIRKQALTLQLFVAGIIFQRKLIGFLLDQLLNRSHPGVRIRLAPNMIKQPLVSVFKCPPDIVHAHHRMIARSL